MKLIPTMEFIKYNTSCCSSKTQTICKRKNVIFFQTCPKWNNSKHHAQATFCFFLPHRQNQKQSRREQWWRKTREAINAQPSKARKNTKYRKWKGQARSVFSARALNDATIQCVTYHRVGLEKMISWCRCRLHIRTQIIIWIIVIFWNMYTNQTLNYKLFTNYVIWWRCVGMSCGRVARRWLESFDLDFAFYRSSESIEPANRHFARRAIFMFRWNGIYSSSLYVFLLWSSASDRPAAAHCPRLQTPPLASQNGTIRKWRASCPQSTPSCERHRSGRIRRISRRPRRIFFILIIRCTGELECRTQWGQHPQTALTCFGDWWPHWWETDRKNITGTAKHGNGTTVGKTGEWWMRCPVKLTADLLGHEFWSSKSPQQKKKGKQGTTFHKNSALIGVPRGIQKKMRHQ